MEPMKAPSRDTGRISLTPMQAAGPAAATDPAPDAESEPEPEQPTETSAVDDSLEEDEIHGRHGADIHSPPSRAMMLKARDG